MRRPWPIGGLSPQKQTNKVASNAPPVFMDWCLIMHVEKFSFVLILFNTVIYVFFIVRFMYSYCSTTLTEGFPCFFLSCKENARV
jgi:hypothetical protein